MDPKYLRSGKELEPSPGRRRTGGHSPQKLKLGERALSSGPWGVWPN